MPLRFTRPLFVLRVLVHTRAAASNSACASISTLPYSSFYGLQVNWGKDEDRALWEFDLQRTLRNGLIAAFFGPLVSSGNPFQCGFAALFSTPWTKDYSVKNYTAYSIGYIVYCNRQIDFILYAVYFWQYNLLSRVCSFLGRKKGSSGHSCDYVFFFRTCFDGGRADPCVNCVGIVSRFSTE